MSAIRTDVVSRVSLVVAAAMLLANLAFGGDRPAFEAYIRKHYPNLAKLSLRVLMDDLKRDGMIQKAGDRAIAKDVFRQLWRKALRNHWTEPGDGSEGICGQGTGNGGIHSPTLAAPRVLAIEGCVALVAVRGDIGQQVEDLLASQGHQEAGRHR